MSDCPKCGCNAVGPAGPGLYPRWGCAGKRLRCEYCGHTWHERDPWPTPKADLAAGKPAADPYPEDAQPITAPRPTDPTPGGAVLFHAVHCPECGSTDTRVTSTRRPIRHHKCRACGETFKSVEHNVE